jgi:hypothetical protein
MDAAEPLGARVHDELTDDELDEILREALANVLAPIEARLDLETGLADIHRRARKAGQVHPRHEAWGVEMSPHEMVPPSAN